MFTRTAGVLFAFALFAAGGRTDDRLLSKADQARKDLLAMQGTWQLESYENGKKDARLSKKRTLFIGGDLFLVREGDKILQAGTLRLVPNRKPKLVDAVVKKGEHEDNTMLGIYELAGDQLRVCFDPEGESRPRKFAAKTGGSLVLATYKRIRPAGEEIDICGKYRSESTGADGKKQVLNAEVTKRGDAYLVAWKMAGGLAYVGTGIRRGDTLSVAWANRGTVGISVYKIEKGPRLVGTYTEVGGPGLVTPEVLTSVRGDWVEVRLR
jgi:uncharacterized protein (TIGR03067 family)